MYVYINKLPHTYTCRKIFHIYIYIHTYIIQQHSHARQRNFHAYTISVTTCKHTNIYIYSVIPAFSCYKQKAKPKFHDFLRTFIWLHTHIQTHSLSGRNKSFDSAQNSSLLPVLLYSINFYVLRACRVIQFA